MTTPPRTRPKIPFPRPPADLDLDSLIVSEGQAARSSTTSWPPPWLNCPWCHHTWHGLDCHADICGCDTSRVRPDDTWRPKRTYHIAEIASHVMAETGVDGWVAQLMTAIAINPQLNQTRLRACLYGRSA